MSEQIIQQAKQKMQQSFEAFERDMSTVRTGRAAPSLIENLSVEAYGSMMKLQEVASITAPEPALLVVQPWDASLVDVVAKMLRTSDFHFNPAVEGTVIRIPLPPLTQDRRQEMVKMVGKKTEEAKISVRNVRQDTLTALKRAKEGSEISEDELAGFEKRVQDLVEATNKQIEAAAKVKEQDLMSL